MEQLSWIVSICVVLAVSNGIMAKAPAYIVTTSGMTEVEFTNGSPVISLDKEQYKDDTLKDVIISIGFHLEQGEESLAEERFLKYNNLVLQGKAFVLHKEHKIRATFIVWDSLNPNQEERSKILAATQEAVKSRISDPTSLRTEDYDFRNKDEDSDLMRAINNLGDMWTLPKEENIMFLSHDRLWYSKNVEKNVDDQYLLSPEWVKKSPAMTENDRVDKANVWVVSAMFNKADYDAFQDFIFTQYVDQLTAIFERDYKRIVLVIIPISRDDNVPPEQYLTEGARAKMVYINGVFADKFNEANKKFGYAITSFRGAKIKTGVALQGDIPRQESLLFLSIFNYYFMRLSVRSLEIPDLFDQAATNPAFI